MYLKFNLNLKKVVFVWYLEWDGDEKKTTKKLNSEVKSCKRFLGMLLCYVISCICFFAFVNVRNTLQWNKIIFSDMTWYPSEFTTIARSNGGYQRHIQYLNSQQLFYYITCHSIGNFGNKIQHQAYVIQKSLVDVSVTIGDVTKIWYWLAYTRSLTSS